MKAERTGVIIKPDPKRVMFRPFDPHNEERALKVIARVMTIPDDEVDAEVARILREFDDRHLRLPDFFLKRFEHNQRYLLTDQPLSKNRKLLIGAFFTSEYSLESAALFNPSMVWHPDQSGLPGGARRFIISLRATGEGHISSLVFRSGIITADYRIELEPTSRLVTAPEIRPDPSYDRELFQRKLLELGLAGPFVSSVLAPLGEHFTLSELSAQLRVSVRTEELKGNSFTSVAEGIQSLAESNYSVRFNEELKLGERIIFPSSPADVKGIEDARFVEFVGDDGNRQYYATYTAYNGHVFIPQLLETTDFVQFRISTLNGPEVKNKGFAMFPRLIDGCFAMISRQDNENIYIMYSDMIHFWYSKQILLKPTFSWEFVQLGNCGSPIETEAGWLVLSHGVGPMRKYSIGAFLLDLDDPTRVIGRLRQPLLSPDENEREGYVPNVVYSCGGQVFGDRLVIPYAMADYASSFATVELKPLLDELIENGNGN
jgi:predicted GH43/DUF377 family glycosyl hydrolase